MLLGWAFLRFSSRGRNSYIQAPVGVRSLDYPSLLLQRARGSNPAVRKLLLFGDSTVWGSSSSKDQNIPAALAPALVEHNTQLFAFALNGLTPGDFQNLLTENALSNDDVIIELNFSERQLGMQNTLATEDRLVGSPGLLIPFMVVRNEVLLLLGKTPAIARIDSWQWFKHLFSKKRPPANAETASFSKARFQDDTGFRNSLLEHLTTPLSDRSLHAVQKTLETRRHAAGRTLVYITPLNPSLLGGLETGSSAIFHSNIAKIEAFAAAAGLPLINYATGTPLLESSDFHDHIHLTDQGCAKFGAILAADWLRVEGRKAP